MYARRALFAAMLLLVITTMADADPRWWQHDRLVPSSTGNPRTWPDISIPGGEGAGQGGGPVMVWQELDPASMQSDVYLTLTPDGGCNWCPPVAWAADPAVDETRPRLEVGMKDSGMGPVLSIQVVYEREGQTWVSFDASLVPWSATLCDDLKTVVPGTLVLSQGLLPGEVDSRPRIAKGTDGWSLSQFFVVWQRTSSSGSPQMHFARDLNGDGSGWTTLGDMGPEIGATGAWPDVIADVLDDAWPLDVRVTVFYQDTGDGLVRMTRNPVAGNPGAWAAPVAVGSGAGILVAADSGTHGMGLDNALWNGAAWQDTLSQDVFFDAALYPDPLSPLLRNPDFDATADSLASAFVSGLEPSLSIGNNWDPLIQPTGCFVFWPTDAAEPEILARGGVLDPTLAPVRSFDVFPFEPARLVPDDGSLPVMERRLSNCSWNEVNGGCDAELRPAGSGARHVSSADSMNMLGPSQAGFYVVFSDDRSGQDEIYLKMTDDGGQAPMEDFSNPSDTGCEGLLRAFVDVNFHPVFQCEPPALGWPEFMERYLIYYGTESADGAFPQRHELAAATVVPPAPGEPYALKLGGMDPGTTYYIMLMAEDQARNIAPEDFDPASNTNGGMDAQKIEETTPPCSPAMDILRCPYNGAWCPPGAPVFRDPYPGESVSLTISFTNTGDWEASDLTGTVNVTNAVVVDPPGGVILIPGPIAASGGSATLPVELVVDPDVCPGGGVVDVSIPDLASDGALSYGLVSCGAAFPLSIDCSAGPCAQIGACCEDGGSCSEIEPMVCDGLGGQFQGNGSSCAADCVWGACCEGDVCTEDRLQSACQNLSGLYQGDGSDCSGDPCAPPCQVSGLASVGNTLMAVKDLFGDADDIVFSWLDPSDGAVESHVNFVDAGGSLADAHLGDAGVLACTAVAPAVSCPQDDGVSTGDGDLYYQAFSACGAMAGEEGPF